jgi:hypothetical protein
MNRSDIDANANERRLFLRGLVSAAGIALTGCAATSAARGGHGFEDTVAEIAKLEEALSINDLGSFTAP